MHMQKDVRNRRIKDNLWNDYREWLLDQVGFYQLKKGHSYNELMAFLHNTEFTAIIKRDENRIKDGLYLRRNYGVDFNQEDFPCSVLEVLVALAIRVEREYLGDPGNEHPEHLFLEMIDNLGLSWYNDLRYREEKVYKIVSDWLERRFYSSGLGSICPLKGRTRDQRVVEIWDQMMAYINQR